MHIFWDNFSCLTSARLRQFKKDFHYDTDKDNLRKCTAAHIEEDFTKYFATIQSLQTMRGTEAIACFVNLLSAMQELSSQLLGATKVHADALAARQQIAVEEIKA